MVAHVPLRALTNRIAELRAAELALFEQLGHEARTTADVASKPVFAACAQHLAWHAELWAERMPSIADVDVEEATDTARAAMAALDETATAETYAAALHDLILRCQTLADDVDPTLDPATARVCALVVADLERDRAVLLAAP